MKTVATHDRPREKLQRLGAIAGVDGAREGEAVITLVDGFVRLLQGRGGRSEGVGCVLFGAGGACGVDRLLCAIDFLLGRFRASCDRHEQGDRAEQDGQARHRHKSIAGYGVR